VMRPAFPRRAPARRARGARRASGFTLIEVLVALALLELGLLGCMGTLLLAERHMAHAERLHVATQRAAGVADSLLAAGGFGEGEVDGSWGTLAWSGGGDGVVL